MPHDMLSSHPLQHWLRPSGTSPGSAFHRLSLVSGRWGITSPTPFPRRPTPPPQGIGSKRGVTPPSALRSRTSPIRGMRLQRLLTPDLAVWSFRDGSPGVPFGVCSRQLAFCLKGFGCKPKPFGQSAVRRAICRLSPALLPTLYSELQGTSLVHLRCIESHCANAACAPVARHFMSIVRSLSACPPIHR